MCTLKVGIMFIYCCR